MKIFLFVIQAIISYLIAGYIHELGHVVMGLCNGWKFERLVLGPLGFKRDNEKVKCYFEKNVVLWAGVGGTMPSKNTKDNIHIWRKVLLAGPMSSIIIGVLIVPLALYTKILFLILLSFISIGIGLSCFLPMKTGILYTDGARYYRLKKGGREGIEEEALFNLTVLNNIKDEAKEVDYNYISALIDSKDKTIRYYGYYFAFEYFKKQQDSEKAKEQILKMKELEDSVPIMVVKDCMVSVNEYI